MRHALPLLIAVAFLTAATYAGDKDGSNANSVAVVESSGSTSVNPAAKSPPKIKVIGYYSAESIHQTPTARGHHVTAKKAIDQVQKPVSEGGMGVQACFRKIEDPNSWKELISNCTEGEAEAESYRPLLHRGGVVIVITDVDEKEWFYGPAVLNTAMNGYPQIVYMQSENERLNPNRCGRAVAAQTPKVEERVAQAQVK